MTRICPQCSQENHDQAAFCSRCGFRFLSAEDVATLDNHGPVTPPNPAYSGYPAQANPPQPAGSAPYPSQYSPTVADSALYALQPGGSAYEQPKASAPAGPSAGDPYRAPEGVYQQQQQLSFTGTPYPQGQPGTQLPPRQPGMQPPQGQPGMQPPPNQQYYQPAGLQGAGQGLPVVQRAFAGKGTSLSHTSWLLDKKQVSPLSLRSTMMEKIQQRYPNEVRVSQEHLLERDAVLEERDYIRIERAPANIFVYITTFGNDLYIARTTTVQLALSPVRMAVLGSLFLLMLIGFIASAAGATSAVISLSSALLLIFFIAIALHSLVLGLTEKDFLAYLRPNILNDFRIDDSAMLEHVVDKGIREASEELGLDTSPLDAPAHNYPARRPLRVL